MTEKIVRKMSGSLFDTPAQGTEPWIGAISVPAFPHGSPEREAQLVLLGSFGDGPYRIHQRPDGGQPELWFEGSNEVIQGALAAAGYEVR